MYIVIIIKPNNKENTWICSLSDVGKFFPTKSALNSDTLSAIISSGNDPGIFILTANRSLLKDRLNKKNWTVILSGSTTNHGGADEFK